MELLTIQPNAQETSHEAVTTKYYQKPISGSGDIFAFLLI